MNIGYDKLRKMIELYAVPSWQGKDSDWIMRQGGGETYVQDIVNKVKPLLQEYVFGENTAEKMLSAVSWSKNLLSIYETMFAKIFIKGVEEGELFEHMSRFLFGDDELKIRLQNILNWAKVTPLSDQKKKAGFSPQVVSYLLAMSDPRRHAYCKPIAYKSAVISLLPGQKPFSKPIDRILHCRDLYLEILSFLENEFQLTDGNLFDVHSLFYKFKSVDWGVAETKSPGLLPAEMTDSTLSRLLMDKHNVVLYGPPGTGKTREAILFANLWRKQNGEDACQQITFHPSYCYEDFIEGYRPDPEGGGFALRDGIFKSLCSKASQNPDRKFLIIIDELNRGDVSRIFGELVTLIENDKRGATHTVILPQSGQTFFIPENLYLLGAMNTADKSISLIDLAIRRRFVFIPCLPDTDIFNDSKAFFSEINGVSLSALMAGLNYRLQTAGVDKDRILGHSYFLIRKTDPSPEDTLLYRLRYEIIPLIEEYCYSEKSLMKLVLDDIVDDNGEINNDLWDDIDELYAVINKLAIEA